MMYAVYYHYITLRQEREDARENLQKILGTILADRHGERSSGKAGDFVRGIVLESRPLLKIAAHQKKAAAATFFDGLRPP